MWSVVRWTDKIQQFAVTCCLHPQIVCDENGGDRSRQGDLLGEPVWRADTVHFFELVGQHQARWKEGSSEAGHKAIPLQAWTGP